MRIEKYFDYRWENDLNQSLSYDGDLILFNQLQYDVKEGLYRLYLFDEFLKTFSKMFSF